MMQIEGLKDFIKKFREYEQGKVEYADFIGYVAESFESSSKKEVTKTLYDPNNPETIKKIYDTQNFLSSIPLKEEDKAKVAELELGRTKGKRDMSKLNFKIGNGSFTRSVQTAGPIEEVRQIEQSCVAKPEELKKMVDEIKQSPQTYLRNMAEEILTEISVDENKKIQKSVPIIKFDDFIEKSEKLKQIKNHFKETDPETFSKLHNVIDNNAQYEVKSGIITRGTDPYVPKAQKEKDQWSETVANVGKQLEEEKKAYEKKIQLKTSLKGRIIAFFKNKKAPSAKELEALFVHMMPPSLPVSKKPNRAVKIIFPHSHSGKISKFNLLKKISKLFGKGET